MIVAAYIPGNIKRMLKHPMLVGVKLWALAHLLANGDLASIILFGAILAWAVFDRITAQTSHRSRRAADPVGGRATTSVVVVGTRRSTSRSALTSIPM